MNKTRFEEIREANRCNNVIIDSIMQSIHECSFGMADPEKFNDIEHKLRAALMRAYTEGTQHNETWK